MSIMLDPMADTDDSLYLKKSDIDRSVGYLIGGVVFLLFFLLTVVGMTRIQKMTDGKNTENRFTPEETTAEICDSVGAGVRD